MDRYSYLLNLEFWGNTGKEYIFSAAIFLIALFVLKIFQVYVLRKLKKAAEKTKTDLDDVMIDIFQSVKPPFYSFVAFYVGLKFLNLTRLVENIIDGLFILVLVYQVIGATEKFINYATEKLSSKEGGKVSRSVTSSISLMAKLVLWSFAVLLILSNWGVNITSLIAGLGIGGIAVALAVQKILSDIFSSFSIFMDKPFEEGDFIVIGQDAGVVQKIGIKTTRIRTLQGEELVVSNQEITNQRVRNFKKMQRRRVAFSFGVLYETEKEKLEKIPDIVKNIFSHQSNAELDRVHFKEFGDFSLNYEVVYYVNSNDYLMYMDIQQSINLALKEEFEKEGIEFAYPTQTIFVKK